MVKRQNSGTLKLDAAECWASKPGSRTGVPKIQRAGKDILHCLLENRPASMEISAEAPRKLNM